MISVKKELKLPEGSVLANVSIFGSEDRKTMEFIYENWVELCNVLKDIGARGINIPEGLSEPLICMYKSWYRVNNSVLGKAKSSFDAYDPNSIVNNNRIQIKACSVKKDLTSFGPKSEWDRIFFADFYNDGMFDGKVVLYELNTKDILEHKVNNKQSLKEQQEEKRRPRFSVKKDLINNGKYLNKEEFNIFELNI